MTRWLLSTVLVAGGCVDQPPGAPGLAISPKAPTSTDDLRAEVSGHDDVPVIYRWYRDNEFQADLNGNSVAAEHTTRSEIWTVIVALKVDGVEGVPVGGEVEIGNAPPEVVLALPPTGAPGSRVVPHVVVSDADDPGEEAVLAYAWSNDANDETQDTEGLSVPLDASAGTVWTLSATATDPQGLAGPTATASTVVTVDTGTADTGTAHTGTADTGTADTGNSDTGSTDDTGGHGE